MRYRTCKSTSAGVRVFSELHKRKMRVFAKAAVKSGVWVIVPVGAHRITPARLESARVMLGRTRRCELETRRKLPRGAAILAPSI